MNHNLEALIEDHARSMAAQMVKAVEWAGSEEDIRHECNTLIDEFIRKAGLTVRGQHEYGLASGRIDSKYGGVVIEYFAYGTSICRRNFSNVAKRKPYRQQMLPFTRVSIANFNSSTPITRTASGRASLKTPLRPYSSVKRIIQNMEDHRDRTESIQEALGRYVEGIPTRWYI